MASGAGLAYAPLAADSIRLVNLQPGSYEDDIVFTTVQMQFTPPTTSHVATQKSDVDVQKTLPEGWNAFRTPEGRRFYQNVDVEFIAYEHPNAVVLEEKGPPVWRCPNAFEALSYVWGDPWQTHLAYARSDSETGNTKQAIGITHNLDSALRHLRCQVGTRTLWIDALCINQNNNQEKSAQLPLMGLIYASASKVLAWTGEAASDSQLALKTLEYLGKQLEFSETGWKFRAVDAKEEHWFDDAYPLPYTQVQWTALEGFFSRTWFERLWVVQEIIRGEKHASICCGHDEVSFYYIRRAVVCLSNKRGVPRSLDKRLWFIAQLAHGLSLEGPTTLSVMARSYRCALAHDKIYALLDFFGETLRAQIRVSYEVPFGEICRDLLLRYAALTHRLDLMAQCRSRYDDSIGPSWVPDWRSHGPDGWFGVPRFNQASGISQARFKLIEPNVLQVCGKVHGYVSSFFPHMDGPGNAKRVRESVSNNMLSQTYPTGERAIDALARLLLGGKYQDRITGVDFAPDLERVVASLSDLCSNGSEPDDGDLEAAVGETMYCDWALGRFALLSTGYFARVPLTAQHGDHVCVLLGVQAPLAFRPERNNRFSVVGSCYVPGLMDSESLLGELPYGWEVHQVVDYAGHYRPEFFNSATGTTHKDDPRLPSIPKWWHRTDMPRTSDEPIHVDYFENEITKEVINYDPRMTRQALEDQGVELRDILLV